MQISERSLLIETQSLAGSSSSRRRYNDGLSVFFAIICIVDVFGVFPVIALPKAIIDCGFYGPLIIVIVCGVQMYTATLLGRCWTMAEKIEPRILRKNRYPYTALAELTYGKGLAKIASLLLDITVFGGGIPNLIVASQNLELLGLRISNNNFYFSSCYWMIITGGILCPILWLGSPKDMKILCSISVFLVLLVFLLVTSCLLISPAAAPEEPIDLDGIPTRPLWQLVFASYGIVSFQFDIHPSSLTIQVDMRDKSKLSLAILGGFMASLGMFSVVCLIAAIRFGNSTQPSILETLATTVPLHFAALFVAIQLCLSSAISNNVLYQHMEDCMQISRRYNTTDRKVLQSAVSGFLPSMGRGVSNFLHRSTQDFNQRRCILRTTLTLFAILIAESVPRFDLVMSLIGGTLTGPLAFIFPPLFYLRMIYLESKHRQTLPPTETERLIDLAQEEDEAINNFDSSLQQIEVVAQDSNFRGLYTLEIVFCVLIVTAGSICTVATTYANVTSAIMFANFTQPCICNVSSALLNL